LKKSLSKFCSGYKKGCSKWLERAIFNDIDNVKQASKRANKIKESDSNSWSRVYKTLNHIINNSSVEI